MTDCFLNKKGTDSKNTLTLWLLNAEERNPALGEFQTLRPPLQGDNEGTRATAEAEL